MVFKRPVGVLISSIGELNINFTLSKDNESDPLLSPFPYSVISLSFPSKICHKSENIHLSFKSKSLIIEY